MKKLLLTAAALVALTTTASAQVILGGTQWTSTGTTLTLENAVPPGNQPINNPCLICGTNQPGQPLNFGYNNFDATGNVDSYRMFSTATVGGSLADDVVGTGYDVSFLRAFLLSQADPQLSFAIGIDVNQTNDAQTLESFAFLNLTTHTVLAQYSLFEPGGTLLPENHNGTGFPDYLLTGLTLDGINIGDQVIFYARWSGANDGPESFFLVAVPGPTVGAGLPGLLALLAGFGGWFGWRRWRRGSDEGEAFAAC